MFDRALRTHGRGNKRQSSDNHELLQVEKLSISFPGHEGRVMVVDNVSLDVRPEETVGLVGESGSGKTVTALAIMGLSRRPAHVAQGRIWFQGEDLRSKTESQLYRIRGSSMSMIFQSPRSSLNPLMHVGDQIDRVFRVQKGMGRKEARGKALEMLRQVSIPEPERHMRSYPHRLSGGMCQRVLVAMMVACEPRLLIADEPTTGLDVTVQAQIFELIKQVQRDHRMAMLLITHDLGVVAELCERMVVMYAGHVMETGTVDRVFEGPRHPYTQMLIKSMLRSDRKIDVAPPSKGAIEEMVYTLTACRFAPCCPDAMDICRQKKPSTTMVEKGHQVMCHLYPTK